MTEDEAREILEGAITENGLYNVGWYLGWDNSRDHATLDGEFSAEDLEAIAFWMRRKHESGSV